MKQQTIDQKQKKGSSSKIINSEFKIADINIIY